MVLDRLRAEEQLRGSLTRRASAGQEERDLELLGREVPERAGVAAPGGLARRGELGACKLRPRRRAEAVREQVPNLRTLCVTGPRIDPASLPSAEGLEVRGYVHELWRRLAGCDVAVVQSGLTTTMELVAAKRPFVSLPLANHFEQRFHVRRRLDRYGATRWLDYEDASPTVLVDAIVDAIGGKVAYRDVPRDGARRAAKLIAELL